MKKRLFMLFMAISCLGMASQVLAKDVTLQWDANIASNIAGYKVYYTTDASTGSFAGSGAAQGSSPVDVKNTTIITLNGLDSAKSYYFKVTAYDTAGNESGFSNMVASSADAAPAPPAPGQPAGVPATVKGDVNLDGTVTMADALLLLRAAADPSLQTTAVKTNGDVWPMDSARKPQGDGVVDLNDARLVLQRAIGLVSW